jgi:CRISPR-associated endonuclease/helicase Cas3
VFKFWGKSPEGEVCAHSVPHHCLDVAAAAHALLAIYPPPFKLPTPTVCALIALHDIGKFSRTFQAQVPDLWPPCLGPFEPPRAGYRHDQVSWLLLTGPLVDLLTPLFGNGWAPASRLPLLRAVAGHHGRPPITTDNHLPRSVACAVCIDAASEFTRAVLDLFTPAPLPKLIQHERNQLTWWLAGFAVVADWLGSSERWFARVVAAEQTDLRAYWQRACAQAERAVREAGLVPAPVATDVGMSSLFPGIDDPRPLQRWAGSVPLPAGQSLVVIEDATGAGKTEAALVLAHRMMVAGRGDGIAFMLPTTATADAIYGRLAAAYLRLFAPSARPSLVLSHSRRQLHERFQDSILDGASADTPTVADEDNEDAPVAAQCAAWIADDRRLAFLGQVSAGTIDQALMAILPAKYSMLRLLGISRRVLIVDEAHAYDAYMGIELARLLEFHASLGGSAVVLSATLTARGRADLCRAFRAGLGRDEGEDEGDAKGGATVQHYPAATIVSADGVETHDLTLAKDLRRSVTVERVATMDTAADAIIAAAASGAAIAWVRNTVGDAIDAVELLRAHGLDPLLFHARFAAGDRLLVEHEVLRLFGPKSTPAKRTGRVLVATQVVEQSLDLDFDLMVSDVAPADLIIQRAGRLWRHPWRHQAPNTRPVAGPRLLLLSPDPVADPLADWLGKERTRFVYKNPAILWRSVRALLGAGHITTHENIRALVEAAYDVDNTPSALAPAALNARKRDDTAAGESAQNVLKFGNPYDRRSGRWEPEDYTPTRDGEPQITLRLATYASGRLEPLCPDQSTYRAWRLSEVSVRAWRAANADNAPETAPAVAALRAGWKGRREREIVVLVLQPAGEATWCGRVIDASGAARDVRYSRTTGLMFPDA